MVLALSESLGSFVNLAKSGLVPAQVFSYLGMAFITRRCEIMSAARRLVRLRTCLSALPAVCEVSACDLQSLLGLMESLVILSPLGRLYKRPLQCVPLTCWSQSQPTSTMLPLAGWLWRL